jgi:hypothetical protein
MASDRPNQRTLDILADQAIRDRAEGAARSLQDAARERQATAPPVQPVPEEKDP